MELSGLFYIEPMKVEGPRLRAFYERLFAMGLKYYPLPRQPVPPAPYLAEDLTFDEALDSLILHLSTGQDATIWLDDGRVPSYNVGFRPLRKGVIDRVVFHIDWYDDQRLREAETRAALQVSRAVAEMFAPVLGVVSLGDGFPWVEVEWDDSGGSVKEVHLGWANLLSSGLLDDTTRERIKGMKPQVYESFASG
ncbi:MAG TPA: hypothetical protein VI893_10910, partial [Thermoplasmata archaeon]|nr:hypothetical protein [Thermoplasmata archaeon]